MTDDIKTNKNEKEPLPASVAAAPDAKKGAAAPKAQKERPKRKGPWMYVGPTVPGIGVQNRVYTEIPAEAQKRAENAPEILHLFIPVKDYPMANRMLREGAGYIHNAYCKAEKMRKGGSEL